MTERPLSKHPPLYWQTRIMIRLHCQVRAIDQRDWTNSVTQTKACGGSSCENKLATKQSMHKTNRWWRSVFSIRWCLQDYCLKVCNNYKYFHCAPPPSIIHPPSDLAIKLCSGTERTTVVINCPSGSDKRRHGEGHQGETVTRSALILFWRAHLLSLLLLANKYWTAPSDQVLCKLKCQECRWGEVELWWGAASRVRSELLGQVQAPSFSCRAQPLNMVSPAPHSGCP